MDEGVIELTDENFEPQALKSPVPVLACFTIDDSPPCARQGPTLGELARAYAQRLTVGVIDADRNSQTSSKHKIDRVPTLLMLKDGNEEHRVVGFHTQEQLTDLIRQKLEIDPA